MVSEIVGKESGRMLLGEAGAVARLITGRGAEADGANTGEFNVFPEAGRGRL